jgi:hypothetical protein
VPGRPYDQTRTTRPSTLNAISATEQTRARSIAPEPACVVVAAGAGASARTNGRLVVRLGLNETYGQDEPDVDEGAGDVDVADEWGEEAEEEVVLASGQPVIRSAERPGSGNSISRATRRDFEY